MLTNLDQSKYNQILVLYLKKIILFPKVSVKLNPKTKSSYLVTNLVQNNLFKIMVTNFNEKKKTKF